MFQKRVNKGVKLQLNDTMLMAARLLLLPSGHFDPAVLFQISESDTRLTNTAGAVRLFLTLTTLLISGAVVSMFPS